MSHHPLQQETAAARDLSDPLNSQLNQHFNTPAAQLAPSSGFIVSVMDAIHQHATVPPPIPFPWKRALFGLTTAFSALMVFLVCIARSESPSSSYPLGLKGSSFSVNSTQVAIASILMAIALSAAAIIASFRLAGRST